jgi:NAD(P)-dependent dehydrogenase (short-subunit alcohol dehydrogenase family)
VSRILITGSSDGLGLMAGQLLAEQGHQVTLHARNEARARDARKALPAAERVLVADAGSLAEVNRMAREANATGVYDAVIHNVAIGYQEPRRTETADGIERVFAVNVLAPYLLTALLTQPGRLVYLSSGLHHQGDPDLRDVQWNSGAPRRWNGTQAYSNSKLFDVVLAFAVARRWPGVLSNALEPGWVATKMGGPGAPDDLSLGHLTQAWLAVSADPAAQVTGKYFFHQKLRASHPAASDPKLQDALLVYCGSLTGVRFPERTTTT